MSNEQDMTMSADGRSGGYMRTASGKKFSFTNLDPENVDIYDIARGLAAICRYNGHIPGDRPTHYSVAQHCSLAHDVILEETGDRYIAIMGLMHDSAEAYIGDMVNPLKQLFHQYRYIEKQIEKTIQLRFKLNDWNKYPIVKDVDTMLFVWERVDIHDRPIEGIVTEAKVPDRVLFPWDAARAEVEFLERFNAFSILRRSLEERIR